MRLQTGFLVSALVLVGACSAVDSTEDTAITTSALGGADCDADRKICTVHPEVIATGIPGAGAIVQVGQFRRSSPLHDKASFLPFVAPGAVLNGGRLLVASSSNYGAPLYRTDQNPGTLLSIDPASGGAVAVPAGFASAGGQASAVGGLVQVYASNNAAFVNKLFEPQAVTKEEVSASLPTGISINNGNGRPWASNSPGGAAGDGTITVLDPQGFPLAGAPDPVAGGVFAGNETNKSPSSTHGLTTGSLGTAIIMKSSDGTGKAVFASVNADGSIVQVHVLKGVDGMVPAGTLSPLGTLTVATANSNDKHTVSRIGMTFNWVPNRVLYVPDPATNRVLAFDITDDGTLFVASAARSLANANLFDTPVDVAPTVPEGASENFASNTTAAGGADLYVLNRGDNSVVRVTQAGKFVARRHLHVGDHHHFRANGIGVSPDGRNIWISGQTATDGMVVRIDGFGSGDIMPALMSSAPSGTVESVGAFFFTKSFSADEGVGPLFNAQSCVACHGSPAVGGGSATIFDKFFTTNSDPANVARFHSVAELPGEHCGLDTGVPHDATGTSTRSTMSLRSTSLIDFVQPQAIVANAAAEPAGVRGRIATLPDGRIGRFGWKANVATLVEFMGGAYLNEMGLTNGLVRKDLENGCGANKDRPELDAVPLGTTAAFLTTVDAPAPTSCQSLPGAALFTSSGCSGCHTPSFAGPGVVTAWLYSDLLLHDMGAGLADGLAQGAATGSEFRTMTLVSVAERSHFLHDGRALNLTDAITAHGGQGAAAAAAFSGLSGTDQSSLLTFLNCL